MNVPEAQVIFICFYGNALEFGFFMIGGLKTIPKDIWMPLKFLILRLCETKIVYNSAIFPYIITGSLLAWAQGWSLLIVAERCIALFPNGMVGNDPLGLGSLLVIHLPRTKFCILWVL